MEYAELKIGMSVNDGYRRGVVEKIYKKTVHVRWGADDKWIYDLDHLQFLSKLQSCGKKAKNA